MLQYTIVIENNDGNDPDQIIECKNLMIQLTRLVNDHTIHRAECYVHDTSLPGDTSNKKE